MKAQHLLYALLAALLAGCGAVNQPIQIEDGSVVEGNLRTVNGSIRVGSDCEVQGSLGNVNGSIEVGSGSRTGAISNTNGTITLHSNVEAGEVRNTNGGLNIGNDSMVNGPASTVNGRIRIADNTQVNGDLSTVNGTMELASGVRVDGKISTVNGNIQLDQAHALQLETATGSVSLLNGSVIEGELRVRETRQRDRDIPRIVIGENSQVGGPLVFEREVRLLIHDSAEVGDIEGATAEYYSGDEPPR